VSSIDAVLFDAGGVLLLPDPTVLAPLLAPYGANTSTESLVRAHYAAMRTQDFEGKVHDDWHVYDNAYVAACGVPEHERDEAATILGATRTAHLWRWPIVPSVVALRSLHEAGVPIGVVSNAAGQIESVLRRFGVCQVGEGDGVPVVIIIDSTIVGVAKPDPAIFSFALDVLDAKPEHVAYVGDSYANDVVGARAAGMRPFLLDPYDDHAGADYERIKAVADLVPIVRAGDDRSR
jgi:putative hydrolase of the HAD superfamily